MMEFNERAFLIKALIAIFVFQFLTVIYQNHLCQSSISSGKNDTQVALICNNASNSLNETGKLALTTILAILVPSQKTLNMAPSPKRIRKKEEEIIGPKDSNPE